MHGFRGIGSKLLPGISSHADLIGGGGCEVIHSVPPVDTQDLCHRSEAMSGIQVAGVIHAVFEPPHVDVAMLFVELQPAQVMDISPFCMHYFPEHAIPCHIQGSQLKEIIMIQHDTTSPRPYNRIHMISGTKGFAQKWPQMQIALEPNAHEPMSEEEMNKFLDKWEHPLARKVGEKAKEVGGHGGMDFIMDWRLIDCLKKGEPLDQSVYDAAAWSSIIELSEFSVKNKSNSVEVPDFTRGVWESTPPLGIVE